MKAHTDILSSYDSDDILVEWYDTKFESSVCLVYLQAKNILFVRDAEKYNFWSPMTSACICAQNK